MTKLNPPLWQHDCQKCVLLGTVSFHDLYYCPGILGGSVIARYGNDGPEYRSGPVDVLLDNLSRFDETDPLRVAYTLACDKGLI
jgi:hypothetical protein